ESVARASAASPVPVISAVGHESDFTIADLVADVRAPTPSAAAEMVVAAKDEFCSRIVRLSQRLQAAARASLQHRRAEVQVLTSRRGLAGWQMRLAMRARHAAELTHHLRRAAISHLARRERGYRLLRQRLESRDLRRRLSDIRARLGIVNSRLTTAAESSRHRSHSRLTSLAGRLENLSPLAVLARGYAVCWNADRTAIIRSARAVAPGDRVLVTLHEGALDCEVRGAVSPRQNGSGQES
ncbi:MAG: exodeoxyribonuclease VII large subunit, partial [Acidobacteriota bacterium]